MMLLPNSPDRMVEVYFEDIPIGFRARSGTYAVSQAEIIEFGNRFDPRSFHTDPVAARDSVFGGLVAPGCLVFAIRSALVNTLDRRPVYLAGLGLEQMDLPCPVRPDSQLSLVVECVERRDSRSRSDAGIVHFNNHMTNQNNETVLTLTAKVMVARKSPSQSFH